MTKIAAVRRTAKTIFIFLALIFLSAPAYGKQFDFFYRGIRPLGMGDAFTAIADDENAAFYNPAGLDFVKKRRIEAFPLLYEYSSNTPKLMSDLSDINTGDAAATTDILRKHIGKPQHIRLSIFPNYTRRGFELGAFVQGKFDGEAHQPSFPYLDVAGSLDMGAVIALSKGFDLKKKQRLSIGITGMYVLRRGLAKRYSAVELADKDYDFENDMNTGSGFGINIGAIYFFGKLPFKPSVGIAVQNVGGIDFGDAVEKIEQSINIGVAVRDYIWTFPARFALDYKDFTANLTNDKDRGKRIYMGGEVDLHKRLSVRGGLNQGYLSIGAEVRFRFIKLAYARYTEEVGAYAGQKKDERHVLQLTVGW